MLSHKLPQIFGEELGGVWSMRARAPMGSHSGGAEGIDRCESIIVIRAPDVER